MYDNDFLRVPVAFAQSAFAARVIAITGAAHGIGEATVMRAAKLGAHVALLDRDQANLQRVAANLQRLGATFLALYGDVTDQHYLATAVEQMDITWGRIDGWVNNAFVTHTGPVTGLCGADFLRVWQVNVQVIAEAARLIVPVMRRGGGGSIVNVSTVLAHRPAPHNAPYASAKAALEGMTRALAVELAADRIRVNAVLPGGVDTGAQTGNFLRLHQAAEPGPRQQRAIDLHERLKRVFQPLPHAGRPEDLADPILFLLSDAARFVTGVSLPVDGGFLHDGRNWDHDQFVRLGAEHRAFREER